MKIKSILELSAIIFLILILPLRSISKENNIVIKKTIAIDLDGVLNNYTQYEENKIPEIKEGAKEFIQELYKSGYNLVLFTNRKPLLASKWLIENKLDKYFSDVTNVKPIAIIYIDDRAINFNGNYNRTLENIKNFNVYWKK